MSRRNNRSAPRSARSMRNARSTRAPRRYSTEIELDEYESATGNVLDQLDQDTEDETILLADGENPLSYINITESYSSKSFYPDVSPMFANDDPFKNTELVLKFHRHIHPDALKWFIDRMTMKKSKGGAELLIRREPFTGENNDGLVVHVTAASWRQLEVAEMLEIKKEDYTLDDYTPREFKMAEIYRFMDGDMTHDDILSTADKQIVVMHELNHLHSLPGEKFVPGYPHLRLAAGSSLLYLFATKNLITSYFPLHEENELQKVEGKWLWSFFDRHPYEEIRDYFGDSTSLYFNFLAYYTWCLIFPATIGVLISIASYFSSEDLFYQLVIYFSIMNMLFVTAFFIYWQRYQSNIAHNWGTLQMHVWEEARPNYHGSLGIDPITGHVHRKYPYYKTMAKTLGSGAISVVCCGFAIYAMYLFLVIEEKMRIYSVRKLHKRRTRLWRLFWYYAFPMMPSVVYGGVVFFATMLYRMIANRLTEWENHRTETQFERHLVFKMVVFEAANSFSILFYTGFIQKDMILLRSRLFMQLSIVQCFVTVQRCILPILLRKGSSKMHEFLNRNRISVLKDYIFKNPEETGPDTDLNLDIEIMASDDIRVQMSHIEGHMDPYDYDADFDEYLDLYLQFGYIFLFSSVLPLAALLALVCNIGMLYASLYKRRVVYQRPFAKRVANIGAWQQAFELLGVIAVVTNCALLASNNHFREMFPSFSNTGWFLLCVFIEHCILAVQYFVKRIIPKVPYRVKVAMAGLEYRSRQALKREQAMNTRRRLTKVFHPINMADRSSRQDDDEQGSKSVQTIYAPPSGSQQSTSRSQSGTKSRQTQQERERSEQSRQTVEPGESQRKQAQTSHQGQGHDRPEEVNENHDGLQQRRRHSSHDSQNHQGQTPRHGLRIASVRLLHE